MAAHAPLSGGAAGSARRRRRRRVAQHGADAGRQRRAEGSHVQRGQPAGVARQQPRRVRARQQVLLDPRWERECHSLESGWLTIGDGGVLASPALGSS
jgi:hypothetical protein